MTGFKRHFGLFGALLGLLAIGFGAFSAQAEDTQGIAVIQADSLVSYQGARIGGQADTIIRITPNKSKIIRLDRDAASIVVSNPAHASVVLDTPRVLVIIPRVPGATSFTVLDAAGNTILERDVVITGTDNENKYLHIRRICSGNSNCTSNSVYFCPDSCYEVATEAAQPATGAAPVGGGGAAAGGGGPSSGGGGGLTPPANSGDQE